MTYKYLFLFSFIAISVKDLFAQTPFTTTQYVDVNNMRVAANVMGDMWLNGNDSNFTVCQLYNSAAYELFNNGTLWFSAYDANDNLHVSAMQLPTWGNDFWPGPLDGNDTCTYASSQNWAKIWEVSYADIEAFLAISNHTTGNTPATILQWPAKGNPYATGNNNVSLTITEDMAPFVDMNNDGIYNPLDGDYPLMKGDQMLWWVYNDNGSTHNATNGTPLKVEIHATAYAYRRWTLIDNVVYYQYDIINRSSNTFSNFRIGQFIDAGGFPYSAVGYDSAWRMGIAFPNLLDDGSDSGHPVTSIKHMSICGITFVHLPNDVGNSYVPMGSFVFYAAGGNDGYPTQPSDFGNYMRMKYLDSSSYPDNTYWSNPLYACDSNTFNRQFILSTGDMSFSPGETKTIVTALISTDTSSFVQCTNTALNDIDIVADTAWAVYNNPPGPDAVTNIQAQSSAINIYPNPVNDVLNVAYSGLTTAQIIITDITGRTLLTRILPDQSGNEKISMSEYADGIYLYRITDNDIIKKQGKFVKE